MHDSNPVLTTLRVDLRSSFNFFIEGIKQKERSSNMPALKTSKPRETMSFPKPLWTKLTKRH